MRNPVRHYKNLQHPFLSGTGKQRKKSKIFCRFNVSLKELITQVNVTVQIALLDKSKHLPFSFMGDCYLLQRGSFYLKLSGGWEIVMLQTV